MCSLQAYITSGMPSVPSHGQQDRDSYTCPIRDPSNIPWHPMGSHGSPIRVFPWEPMGSHDTPWGPIWISHGSLCAPMRAHRIPRFLRLMRVLRHASISTRHQYHPMKSTLVSLVFTSMALFGEPMGVPWESHGSLMGSHEIAMEEPKQP